MSERAERCSSWDEADAEFVRLDDACQAVVSLLRQSVDGFAALGVRVATGLVLAGLGSCEEALGDRASADDTYRRLLDVAPPMGRSAWWRPPWKGWPEVKTKIPGKVAELLGRAEACAPEETDRWHPRNATAHGRGRGRLHCTRRDGLPGGEGAGRSDPAGPGLNH